MLEDTDIIPLMNNAGRATIIFVCAKCGAAYQATQQRLTVRATGSFSCHVCKEVLHSWAGAFDYFDWRAIEP